MIRGPAWLLLAASVVAAPGAFASNAAGAGLFVSDDADDTTVVKQGVHFDVRHDDADHYLGIELERARFVPFGGEAHASGRAYLRFAGSGERWAWRGKLGTDGDTWLGNASVHAGTARRQEYFIEREVVETPLGVTRGIFHTFAGAAYDWSIDDRNVLTGMVGVQDFTGDNRRIHLRGRYVHVLDPDRGLSVHARIHGYRSSDPGEFDYYSPRWRVEVMPLLQLRRFRGGWQYRVAAGIGRQRDAATDWRRARLFEASITSPRTERNWSLEAAVLHTDTPVGAGDEYGYTQLNASITRAF